MKEMNILINTINKIEDFANIAGKSKCNIDIVQGQRMIDGASIMGLFSINITRPVKMIVRAKNKKDEDEFLSQIASYIVT